MLTGEEMVLAVRAAVSLGIRKVRITGGEPLVRPDILSICRRIGELPGVEELCLTTNGVLLPGLAEGLREAGVSRINLSLDTLKEEKYRFITRTGSLYQALRGLEAALGAGFKKVKINVVLLGGWNEDEVLSFARLTKQYPADVRFIEWMPMYDSGDFGGEAVYPCKKALAQIRKQETDLVEQRGDGGVARLYRLPGAMGNIGFIAPVSARFCGECRRIRLSADGKLKPCLHSGREWSVKGMSFEGMAEQMKQAILAKPECHTGLSVTHRSTAGRNMNQIGG